MTSPPIVLVTLAQARAHLRLPPDVAGSPPPADDPDLTLKLAAAQSIVLDYLKDRVDPSWLDELTTPPLVQAAILIQLGELDRFRGDDPDGAGGPETDGDLSPAVTNILRRFRDPALA